MSRELETLLAPHAPATFLRDYWGHRPLHVAGAPQRFESIGFDTGAFWRMVRALPPSAKGLRAIYHDSKGTHQEILEITPLLAEQLFETGLTLSFAPVEDHHEGVRDYVSALRRDLNMPGQITVGVFYSPKGHGAGLHYDAHHAWVVQLAGKKRWELSRTPAIENPPRHYRFDGNEALRARNEQHPDLETRLFEPSELFAVELNAGDMLYMPPGTWHRPRALDGESLHLTLAPYPRSPLELVQTHLARALGERLAWRRSLPVSLASSETPEDVNEVLAARLDDLRAFVNDLRPSDLARLWHSQVAASSTRTGEKREAAPDDEIRVDRTRRLSWLRARDDRGEPKVFLYVDGEEIDLPDAASVFVATLLARDRFVAREAQSWVAEGEEPYAWEDVKFVLEVLLTRGALRRS